MDMRSLWDPWQEMRRLRGHMAHIFTDSMPTWRWTLTGPYPPINLTRSDTEIALEALYPTVDRESLGRRRHGPARRYRCLTHHGG
jgi:hypothetical protein